MTILGSNLRVEVMQFALVLMLAPALILPSRVERYTPVRNAGATLAALAALFWIGARVEFWRQDAGSSPRAALVRPVLGEPSDGKI